MVASHRATSESECNGIGETNAIIYYKSPPTNGNHPTELKDDVKAIESTDAPREVSKKVKQKKRHNKGRRSTPKNAYTEEQTIHRDGSMKDDFKTNDCKKSSHTHNIHTSYQETPSTKDKDQSQPFSKSSRKHTFRHPKRQYQSKKASDSGNNCVKVQQRDDGSFIIASFRSEIQVCDRVKRPQDYFETNSDGEDKGKDRHQSCNASSTNSIEAIVNKNYNRSHYDNDKTNVKYRSTNEHGESNQTHVETEGRVLSINMHTNDKSKSISGGGNITQNKSNQIEDGGISVNVSDMNVVTTNAAGKAILKSLSTSIMPKNSNTDYDFEEDYPREYNNSTQSNNLANFCNMNLNQDQNAEYNPPPPPKNGEIYNYTPQIQQWNLSQPDLPYYYSSYSCMHQLPYMTMPGFSPVDVILTQHTPPLHGPFPFYEQHPSNIQDSNDLTNFPMHAHVNYQQESIRGTVYFTPIYSSHQCTESENILNGDDDTYLQHNNTPTDNANTNTDAEKGKKSGKVRSIDRHKPRRKKNKKRPTRQQHKCN